MEKETHGKYLTVRQLSKYINLSPSWIWQNWPAWTTKNKIRTYRVGNKLQFNRDDVDRALESRMRIN